MAVLLCGYVLLMLVSNFPLTRKFLADNASQMLQQKFGTEVKVGDVQLGLFNSVILDSVLIKDRQGRNLFVAEKVSAKIRVRSLFFSPLTIRTVELYRAKADLVKADDSSPYNFQFIVDSLSGNGNSGKGLNLKIKSIILNSCSLTHNVNSSPAVKTFDFKHLRLNNIDASIGVSIKNNGHIGIKIRDFAFQEKSGLTVKHGYAYGNADGNAAEIPLFRIETPSSKIKFENVKLLYGKHGISGGEACLSESRLSMSDIQPFVETKLPDMTFNLSSSINYRQKILSANAIRIAESKGRALVRANAQIYDFRHFYANVPKLELSNSFLTEVAKLFKLKGDGLRVVENIGDVDVNSVIRWADAVSVNATMTTGAGKLKIDVQGKPSEKITSSISSSEFQLGKLLGKNSKFGNADFNARIEISGLSQFNAKVNIEQLLYNKYNFNKITAELAREKNNCSFNIRSLDNNMKLSAQGTVDFVGNKLSNSVLKGKVESFNPHALNFTKNYKGAAFSAGINATLGDLQPNSFAGNIELSDFSVSYADSTQRFGNISLVSRHIANGKNINLKGDFGEASISGKFDFNKLPKDFMHVLNDRDKDCSAGNVFDFNLHILDAKLINLLGNLDIDVGSGNYVSGYFDSSKKCFQLEGLVPTFRYKQEKFSDISLYMKGDVQNVGMRFHASKIQDKGKTEIESTLKNEGDDLLNTIVWTSNAGHKNSGEISQRLSFPEGFDSRIVSVLNPSNIVVDDSVWNISPAHFVYEKGKLHVSNLKLKHGGNELALNGVVSKSVDDSLQVELRNIRIEDILTFVGFDDVHFDGKATGRASVSSLMLAPQVNASVDAADFVFNHAPMGKLKLESHWNNDSKKIEINAIINDGDFSTGISGYVSPEENNIDLNFRAHGTNALFLNDFFPEAMKVTQGRTYGNLRLFGNLHAMNLEGFQNVTELKLNIEPLGTSYSLNNDTVRFTPDLISFPSFRIIDEYENVANLSGYVKHRALHNFSYDMTIAPHAFLAYDKMQSEENSSFWGTAFVDGMIHLYGGSGFFTTEANVTPKRNTLFVYNADQPENSENAEFLTFRSSDESPMHLRQSKDSVHIPQKQNNIGTDIRLEFNINMNPDAELRVIMDDKSGNLISTHGHGNIKASFYNKGAFDMFGIYNIDNGSYKIKFQDLIQKNFSLREGGRIVFNGNPLACALNLQALYSIPAVSLAGISMQGNLRDNSVPVECVMNITGNAMQPIINFDIDLPSVSADQKQMVRSLIATPEDMNMQAMYLLSVGRFYTYNNDMANSEQTSTQTSMAMNSFLSSTLSSNINNLLQNFGGNNRNWSFGTNLATGSDGWNDMDVEGMFTGRLFKGRLLIDGNLGYRDRSAYNSNFIGDFSARYLLNSRGTIQLKAYNESNDRYFTKSTLTTQGGGIVFRKSFTRFSELFKKKKTNDNKKSRDK